MTVLLRCIPFLALVAPLGAQTIYVDCGNFGPVPSSAYGAAAGVPGVWNLLPGQSTVALVDRTGAPTSAQAITTNCDSGFEDFATTSGDDAALLDDWNYTDCAFEPHNTRIQGLRAGTYALHLYPLGGGSGTGIGIVVSPAGSVEGTSSVSMPFAGPFPGSFADWGVATRIVHVDTEGGAIRLNMTGTGLSGIQLVSLSEGGTFCDGSLGDCPCGVGLPGAGCPSTYTAAGARLGASGGRSVTADSLVLTAQDVTNSVVLFFQGSSALGSGRGVAFGDGLRCAGGMDVRLAARAATNHVVSYPGPGDVPISVRGALPGTGGFRVYQVWYRNAPDYCTIATYNLTSAVAVDWLP